MEYILSLLGFVMVVEGLPYFLAPGKVKEFLALMAEKPDKTLRIMGFSLMSAGLFLVWMVKR